MMSPNGVSGANENGYVPVATTEENNDESVDCKENEETEKSSITDSGTGDLIVAPDGGWGWVIVLASFLANMVVDGNTTAFGMFISEISKSFNVSVASVAFVGSLSSGFYLMAGPFASALANRFGFRLVAIIGSIISAIAFGISYFSYNITSLCIIYGMIGGIGYGLIYVPAVIIVGFYFEKLRGLAMGIAVCGSGVGTFVFAPLYSYLVTNTGWRNTVLVEAVLILMCALFACTFRPLKPTKIKDLEEKEVCEKPELIMDSSKLPAATRMKMEAALANMKDTSYHTVGGHTATIPKILGVSNNAAYPSALEVFRPDKVYHTIHVPQHNRLTQLHHEERRPPIPFRSDEDHGETDKSNGTSPLLSDNLTPVKMSVRRHTMGDKRTRMAAGDKNHVTISTKDINRPLYRDDIFFSGSLTRLPQYTSQSSVAYNLSVVRPPTKHEIEEETKQECKLCPESIRRPLATMLDISVLKSPSFLLLAFSGFLTMVSFYIPFIFIKDRALLNHVPEASACWLVSAIGISNTIGRVFTGYLTSKFNVILVNNVTITLAGIATMLSDLWFSEVYQFAYCIIFGLTISSFSSIRSLVIVELVGLERLTNAFGIALLFQGLGACIGAPIAGEIFTATGSYHASFLLSGGIILASAVICYPLRIIHKWEKNRLSPNKEKSVAV